MGNHYHMLLETPEANLVAGMRWLQGVYTQRFNKKHRESGHLLQGRYKALPVECRERYFSTVARYIHLNPARMKNFDPEREPLIQYPWSSYPAYVQPRLRASWLCVDSVLTGRGLKDTAYGRRAYRAEMEGLARECKGSAGKELSEEFKSMRRGWYVGDTDFREELITRLGRKMKHVKRESITGADVRHHDEAAASAWIRAGMQKLKLTDDQIIKMKKSSAEKYALAWLARRYTSASPAWIKERLKMGKATNFAAYLRRLETSRKGQWGYAAYEKVKNITLSD